MAVLTWADEVAIFKALVIRSCGGQIEGFLGGRACFRLFFVVFLCLLMHIIGRIIAQSYRLQHIGSRTY